MGISHKQFARIGPYIIQSPLHAAVAFIAAIPQTDHQIGRALDMVIDFLDRLGGNFGDPRMGRILQRFQQFQMP